MALVLSLLKSFLAMVIVTAMGAAVFMPGRRDSSAAAAPAPVAVASPTDAPAHPLAALTREPILGLQFEAVTPALAQSDGLEVEAGAIVRATEAGGLAERSGVQIGDVIRRVNDLPIDANHTLDAAILSLHVRGRFSLTVWRQGQELTIQVDLNSVPDGVQS